MTTAENRPLFMNKNEYDGEVSILLVEDNEIEVVMNRIGDMKYMFAITESKDKLNAVL